MDHAATACPGAPRGASAVTSRDDDLIRAIAPDLERLQRFARLIGGDTADDLVAESLARMLPVWRRSDIADPSAYLRRAIVNLARRRWRRRALARHRDVAATSWLPTVADDAERFVERERTLRAVASLPPRKRAVIVLRFYEDLSLEQIAQVLGVRVGTVKSQLARALEHLRTELDDLDTP